VYVGPTDGVAQPAIVAIVATASNVATWRIGNLAKDQNRLDSVSPIAGAVL